MSDHATKLLVFDDASETLGPMTRRLAAFELLTGGVTSLARIERRLGRPADALRAPGGLAATTGRRHTTPVNAPLDAGPWRVVSGRWHAQTAVERVLDLRVGEALVERDGAVVAAVVPAELAEAIARGEPLPDAVSTQTLQEPALYARPWDVVRFLPRTLPSDLDTFEYPQLPSGHVAGLSVVGEHAARAHPSARVVPPVTFDATLGPIVIDQRVEIRPFVSIQGPVYVGPDTVVQPFTSLRPHTALGPHCRVGGEISHSLVQGYSNKAHGGYLGNACVGQWCNLGADTTVSNLKNTYGAIRTRLEPDADAIDTGLTHQGPVIADMVRTAIGTLVPTGGCLDFASSIARAAGFAPKYAAPFSWVTDAGCETYDLTKLIQTLRLSMARRGVELDDDEAAVVRALHERYASK